MKIDGVVVGCVIMSVSLYMHLLWISMSICCYACIFMVKVVMHKVIRCNYVIVILLVCYDANELVEIKQEI